MLVNRLSTRRNLIFINLAVIGFIIWLTISFLYLAVDQRKQSLHLEDSLSTGEKVLATNSQIAIERTQLQRLLVSETPANSAQQLALKYTYQETDNTFSLVRSQLAHQMSQTGYSERLPASIDSIMAAMSKLNRLKTYLDVYRGYSLDQIVLPFEERDSELTDVLFDTYNQTTNTLLVLSEAMQYLPDRNASLTSNLQLFNQAISIVNAKLSLKVQLLDKVQLSPSSLNQQILTQLKVTDAEIVESLDRLVSTSVVTDFSPNLSKQTKALRSHYFKEIGQKTSKILAGSSLGHSIVIRKDWQTVTLKLKHRVDALADSGFYALRNLTTAEVTRATRNLIIDAFLLLLCAIITIESIKLNRRVKQLAYHDSLTGLPNRINFETALMSAGQPSNNKSVGQAVIFLDLDRFKSINDNYGHAIGDELIKAVAKRLKAHCPPGTMLARLGGDEFGILIGDVPSENWVNALALELINAVKQDIHIKSLNLRVGASAGLSFAPQDGVCGPELLRNADIAMYQCKANNLEGVYRFNQQIAQNYQHRLKIELDLKQALEKDQLFLVYQPKVCTASGRVTGVEALLRWTHPERGFVSPAEFIPVAEDLGLMGKIGDWVLNKACEQIKDLELTTGTTLRVAVNISAQQFNDEKFLQTVYETIDQHELNKDHLELEVTESLVMTDIQRVVTILSTLKESGITIAIDDFGTGYSSLQYLQELPLNSLKIDRAFILALDTVNPQNSVANSIVQLANLFDLETVAEGVETEDQDKKIRSLGVSHIQGYRYSAPVRIEELENAIQEIQSHFSTAQIGVQQKAA